MLALYRAPLLHGNSLHVRNESSGNNDGSFSPVLVTFADAARWGVSVLWSRVRTFPHPRRRYLPLRGLSLDLYGMKRERGGDLIKVGCVGAESVRGVCRRPAVFARPARGTPRTSIWILFWCRRTPFQGDAPNIFCSP